MLLALLPVFGLIGVGLYLLIGTLRKRPPLSAAPTGWFYFFPYRVLIRLGGPKAIYYYHIAVGIVFVFGALGILVYILKQS